MSRVRQDAVSSFSGKEVLHKQELRAVAADAGRVLVVPVYGVGFAEQAVVDESALAPKPPGLDHAHAAAIPLAGQTAWQGLYRHGGPKAGQAVLIHAGSAASAISPCSSPRRAAPGC